MYHVSCSCAYHTTFGIPCRHIMTLLCVNSSHLHIRWRCEYATLYKRKHCENATQRLALDRTHHDPRLLITPDEYTAVMEAATNLQTTRGTADVLFEKEFIPFIRKKNGIIPIKDYKNIPDTQNARMNSLYESGNLSQE